MSTPKKNESYIFYISLMDSSDPSSFKVNPTIVSGDFQISIDGITFENLSTLPVVEPSGSIGVKISLSQAEMNGDKIMIKGIDASGNEWNSVNVFLDLSTNTIDDVAVDLSFIKSIEEGKWEIVNNQMILYDVNLVEVIRFNLFDNVGNPTSENIYKRERV